MKRMLFIILILSPALLFSLDISQELAVGYYDDLGITLGLRVEEPDFPVFVQRRIGTTYQMDPGNDEDSNPREEYTYDDADEAVKQPRFRPYVMLGIIYPIGG